MQISNWSLVVLLFIGVPINLLSLWLLVQKMFNFGAGGWGGGFSGSDSRSLFYRLKCFSTKILGSRNNRRRSFTDRWIYVEDKYLLFFIRNIYTFIHIRRYIITHSSFSFLAPTLHPNRLPKDLNKNQNDPWFIVCYWFYAYLISVLSSCLLHYSVYHTSGLCLEKSGFTWHHILFHLHRSFYWSPSMRQCWFHWNDM